jgi:hypothetical protein
MGNRKRPTRRLRDKAAIAAVTKTMAAHGDLDAQAFLARQRAAAAPIELRLFVVGPPAKKR